jgi:glycosyltransferase involved in cell wall biosynthesis
MMGEKPLVSICIPTCNSEVHLEKSLENIVSQTYKNTEVIISDNASTDNTISIINGYVRKYGFKLYVNPVNIGAHANFNKLIGLASGEYVAIYHSDDVYQKNIVEESVKVLSEDASIGFVGTMGNIIDDQGVCFSSQNLPKHIRKLNKIKYNFDEALSAIVKRGWFFISPSIMARKKVYSELGVFPITEYKSAGDYELWLRIARVYNVGIIDKKLINYRVHKGQATEALIRKNTAVADIVLVLKEYKEYTKDAKLKRQCEDCINWNIIKAARRQNYYGLYSKSNMTLKTINSKKIKFLFHKYGIKFFNMIKVSIKKRTL